MSFFFFKLIFCNIFFLESCVNPIGQNGACLNIRKCEPLMQLLRTHGNSVGEFLRGSVCGFENRDPKVCCPGITNDYDDGGRGVDEYPGPVEQTPPPTPAPRSQYGPLFSPQCGIVNGTQYPKVVNGVPAKLGNNLRTKQNIFN